METKNKILLILFLVTVMVVSMTKVTSWATSVETHEHSISQIDDKISTVLKLAAGSTTASAAISFLPDDDCTPIAEELAELGKYFLVVLSALYLEKYMVTVAGFISFRVLIPAACACLGIGLFVKKDTMQVLAYKLVICAMAIFLVVPSSVKVSDLVYQNYQASISSTISDAETVGQKAEEYESMDDGLLSWIKSKATSVLDYVSDMCSHFIEALAIMIVTSCIIPLLVLVLFIWMINTLFGANLLNVPLPLMSKRKL